MAKHDILNLPSKLFKYYKYDSELNEKRLKGEIFLATPFDFNDPCDCQRDVINNSSAREKAKHKGWVCNKLEELGYSKSDSLKISKSLLKDDTYKYEVYKKQLEKVGILCMTSNVADSLMWGYYANNDGYCIEYDTKKIVHQLVIGYINKLDYETTRRLFQKDRYSEDPAKRTPSLTIEQLNSADIFTATDITLITNGYLAELGDTQIIMNFIKNIYHKRIAASDIEYGVAPDGSPSNLFFDRGNNSSKTKYYKKTSIWEHEQEFRFVVSLGGRFVVNLGVDIIKNVYLGCNMKNEKVIEIAYIISKIGLKCGLHKMKRLKNCGLQAVDLDISECTGKFSSVETYLKDRCKLYW